MVQPTPFIGSMVTIPGQSVPQGVAKYVLIDGQQEALGADSEEQFSPPRPSSRLAVALVITAHRTRTKRPRRRALPLKPHQARRQRVNLSNTPATHTASQAVHRTPCCAASTDERGLAQREQQTPIPPR